MISKFSEAQILPHLQIMQLERKHWNIPACKFRILEEWVENIGIYLEEWKFVEGIDLF